MARLFVFLFALFAMVFGALAHPHRPVPSGTPLPPVNGTGPPYPGTNGTAGAIHNGTYDNGPHKPIPVRRGLRSYPVALPRVPGRD
ncbi:hypothetical protein JX265_003743 [Neoarthrinium moseri]|uniref:Secreted protein n=2 Tax=Neoarthrinium moseri TaxID=1658444 RepID=A0A9P9WTB1_9PEZI|nr:hypothetical protein JX266_009903 [Neoarthrinium moseri]KAI1877735.1 hypothetical protein JX265_003743 [Neoarthrinium moseri]